MMKLLLLVLVISSFTLAHRVFRTNQALKQSYLELDGLHTKRNALQADLEQAASEAEGDEQTSTLLESSLVKKSGLEKEFQETEKAAKERREAIEDLQSRIEDENKQSGTDDSGMVLVYVSKNIKANKARIPEIEAELQKKKAELAAAQAETASARAALKTALQASRMRGVAIPSR